MKKILFCIFLAIACDSLQAQNQLMSNSVNLTGNAQAQVNPIGNEQQQQFLQNNPPIQQLAEQQFFSNNNNPQLSRGIDMTGGGNIGKPVETVKISSGSSGKSSGIKKQGTFFYKLGKAFQKAFRTKGKKRHHRSRCPNWGR